MSSFEFTSALFGFVVALGIARVLGGIADLIRFWRKVAAPGLYLTWFFLLLLIYLGWWISIWRHADAVRVSLLELVVTFHVPVFIYLSTRLLVPTEGDFESIDERYDQVRTPFLCCLAAAGLLAPLLGLIVAHDVGMAYLLTMSLMQLSLLFIRKARSEGASVAISGRSEERLESASATLNGDVKAVAPDSADEAGTEAMFESTTSSSRRRRSEVRLN